MDLAKILDALNSEGGSEKTASASPRKGGNDDRLAAALMSAVEEVGHTKTASAKAAQPAEDLTKIAHRLAAAEQEALVKEAQLYGAAVCDGFMTRMASYEQTGAVKTASASYGDNFEKFASENPELVKQAAELGYRETREKIAAAAQGAYEEGYTKVAHLVKEAAEKCASQGYSDTISVLRQLA